jgi:hypothetical protein
LAQFCGGRCLQREKPQNKPETPENIFRMNLRNICVRTKYFQMTVTELRQTHDGRQWLKRKSYWVSCPDPMDRIKND